MYFRLAVAIGLLTLALALWFVLRWPTGSPNIISLSGRIEGDDSAIASKTSGRILEVRFREVDTVHLSDVIAVLGDEQIRAKENQASAGVARAEAQVASAQAQIEVLKEQLLQNQLQSVQSWGDAKGRVDQAEANLTAARADDTQQIANLQSLAKG